MNPSRKEIAQAFRHAARDLESGRHKFICHALGAQHTDAAQAARDIIMKRLAPRDTYGTWLEATHPEDAARYFNDSQIPSRLYWLSALIKEFSK